MPIRSWSRGWVLALACVLSSACSAGTDGAGGTDTKQNGSTQVGATSGFDSGATGGGGSGDCVRCSNDLHSIVDCQGNVLQTCPPDQGCGAGAVCVPACQAAIDNKSSIGCEYYTANPDSAFSHGACFAAFVVNTWTTPAKLQVERNGEMLDVSTFARIPMGSGTSLSYAPLPNGLLPPDAVAILFLAQKDAGGEFTPACPEGITTAAHVKDAAIYASGFGKAFRITSDVPVSGYDIFPYGGGPSAVTSATLLLPTSAWDNNYVAVEPYQQNVAGDPNFSQYLQIIAAEDGTDVTISPTLTIFSSEQIGLTPPFVPVTYSLSKGQYLQISQPGDLSGSAVQSNKPVGLLGGNRCMAIPSPGFTVDGLTCDAGHQMIPPVRALGTEYVGMRHRNRFAGKDEAPPFRIVGAVADTQLTYEPVAPVGAPTTLAAGQVVEFVTSAPFIVRSQDKDHPFYLSTHMTSCGNIGPQGDCRGDPESVNVIPAEQYLHKYVFFTDPTYPETSLAVVRKAGPEGFRDVTLKCRGTLTGWKPVGAGTQYETTYVDLVTGNFEGQEGCDNGRQEAFSDAPFTITVWGWGTAATGVEAGPFAKFPYSQYVSYAYPAGASVRPLSQVVVPAAPK